METVKLTCPCGKIIGRQASEGVKVFSGVRFAVAERFKKPVTVTKWEGTYEALKPGHACPQLRAYCDEKKVTPFYYHEFREGLSFTYSEDCLFLNIYAPAETQKAPVILYFFGGSFTRGSNDEKPVDGTAYAQKGVIFVAGSYRLNAFGKAVYQGSPANLALFDMLSALEWVRNNIAAFGGDPDNITVMGQSAGAISLQALLFNPEFRQQVTGAILLSGGGFRRGLFGPRSERWIKRFSKHLKGNLQDMDSQELFEEFHAQEQKDKLSQFALLPIYDGTLIRKEDHRSYPPDMPPVIIGTVKNEVLGPRILPSVARKCQRKSKTPVYLYRFMHDLPGEGKANFHSCDLWYALGSLSNSWRPLKKEDLDLAEQMVAYFTAFCFKHVPEAQGLEPWEPRGERIFR
jgi:carboxylesterase type B